MKTTKRRGIARVDSAYTEDPKTGFLHVSIYTAKPGVLTYREKRADGSIETVRELITPEVLHDAAQRATLENKPLMNEHRFDSSGQGIMVNKENAQDFTSGWTSGKHEVAPDGQHTRIDAVVTDAKLISLIKMGKREASPGYDARTTDESGTHPEYGHFDRKQVWRDYNHLVITGRGRGGSTVGIRADSEEFGRFDALEIEPEDIKKDITKNKEIHKMDSIRIKNKDFEVSEAAAIAISHKFDSDQAVIEQLKTDSDSLTDKNKELEGQVTALKADLEKAQNFDHAGAVESRVKLEKEAAEHLPKDHKFDGQSDIDIKRSVVAVRYDSIDASKEDEAVILGMYKAAVLGPKPEQQRTDSGEAVVSAYEAAKAAKADQESGRTDSENAVVKMQSRVQDNWKKTAKAGKA